MPEDTWLHFHCVASSLHLLDSSPTGAGILSVLMARKKQATPSQRATSSELMHLLPDEEGMKLRQQNGGTKDTVANGDAKGLVKEDTPGLMQLVVCVLGIYVSLYVSRRVS